MDFSKIKIPATITKYLDFSWVMKNSLLAGILTLFIGLYGPRLAPSLPETFRALFNNMIFRIIVIFFVLYLQKKDMGLALTILIVYLGSIYILQYSQAEETFRVENFHQRRQSN